MKSATARSIVKSAIVNKIAVIIMTSGNWQKLGWFLSGVKEISLQMRRMINTLHWAVWAVSRFAPLGRGLYILTCTDRVQREKPMAGEKQGAMAEREERRGILGLCCMTGLELAHCMGPAWGRVQLKMPSVQVTELEAQPKHIIIQWFQTAVMSSDQHVFSLDGVEIVSVSVSDSDEVELHFLC